MMKSDQEVRAGLEQMAARLNERAQEKPAEAPVPNVPWLLAYELLYKLLDQGERTERAVAAIADDVRIIKRAVTEPHNPTWFHRGGK